MPAPCRGVWALACIDGGTQRAQTRLCVCTTDSVGPGAAGRLHAHCGTPVLSLRALAQRRGRGSAAAYGTACWVGAKSPAALQARNAATEQRRPRRRRCKPKNAGMQRRRRRQQWRRRQCHCHQLQLSPAVHDLETLRRHRVAEAPGGYGYSCGCKRGLGTAMVSKLWICDTAADGQAEDAAHPPAPYQSGRLGFAAVVVLHGSVMRCRQ
jgi:hypothetical protein